MTFQEKQKGHKKKWMMGRKLAKIEQISRVTLAQVQYLGQLLSEMCDLREKMKDLLTGDDLTVKRREDEDETGCPICMISAKGKQIFECNECGNWVCSDCVTRLENCPCCRTSLNEHPMRRSRALERFMSS